MPTARTVLSSTWALGALVFAATWAGGLAMPVAGSLDVSSHAALTMAIERGLNHGQDIIWPFGPLGFLKSYYVFFGWEARLAALYGAALHLALCLSLVWAARRNFPLVVAIVVALVTATLLRGDLSGTAVREDAAAVVLVFIWCVVVVAGGAPGWVRRIVLLAGPAFAAIEFLAKPNIGVIVLILLAIAVLAIEGDRRRNVAIFATTFAAALAALWFAAGQGLGNFDDYVRSWRELADGFSTGARLEFGDRDYDYFLLPAVVAVVGAIAIGSTRGIGWRRRAGILLMLALVVVYAVKDGLVSHEVFHMATCYSTLLGACVAFRLPDRPDLRYAALVATAGVAVAAFTPKFAGYPLTNPLDNARNAATTVLTLADGGRLDAEIAANREQLIAAYGLDPETLALIDDRTVHVDPSEAAAAWAYELDWHPLPVFQSYSAWTEELDLENARALASDDGPELILRRNANPLGRYPGFESPAAMIAMLCHFRAVRTTESWQVLERVPDRCGDPRPLGTADATYGEPIPVPEAPHGSVVFARVHGVQVAGLERLRVLVDRARSRQVSFDGGHRYVFIPTTAADGLLLRAPARIDFPSPFALAPNAETMAFLLDNEAADDSISVDFFTIPVATRR